MARLIRTEKEVEGRFEEVWLVVEEDPLEQWPAGPAVRRRPPATRADALERVRGEARYTADIQLPGMLHTAVLRSPHAHARVKSIDLAPALALPGVRGALGPGDVQALDDEAGYAGAPVAAVAADTFAQARAAVAAIDVEWELLDAVLDPEEAVARKQFVERSGRVLARRLRAGARAGGRRRRRDLPHRRRPAQLDGDPPGRLRLGRRHAQRLHLDAVHLGHSRRDGRDARHPGRQGARDLRIHGRRLRLEERSGRVHPHRRRARQADGPARALRADAARGEHGSRQPQRDDPEADGRRTQRRDDRRARRGVHQRRRLVRLVGAPTARCRCSTRATTCAPSATARRSIPRR